MPAKKNDMQTKKSEKETTISNKEIKESKKAKIEEETHVEIEESDNESVASKSESEYLSDSDEEEEEHEAKKAAKEKKAKETFQELTAKLDELSISIKEVDATLNKMQKDLKDKDKERNDLERQRNKILAMLSKTHDDEIKKVQKEKSKRKGNKDGGFNKELPVPPKLVKYLGLNDDIKLARPKVMSLLNEKFVNDGLKNGQKTTLDQKTAKALGKEKGRVIDFTEFQSFLKEFYEEAFPKAKNTVEL
jgi:hypothetical protein